MSTTHLLINFRDYLVNCWPNVSRILEQLNWDDDPYFLDNWMQANWELMVERQVIESGQLLVPYGYSSSIDCRYGDRVGAVTHRLTCKQRSESRPQYYFLCFVTKIGASMKIQPPFDLADVEEIESGNRLSIPINNLEFALMPIS